MLENTFCHIPRVSAKTERRLWEAGVRSWGDALDENAPKIQRVKWDALRPVLEESAAELHMGNARYFAEKLPAREQWRLFPHFRHSLAYLDIETTGLGIGSDSISTISVYDGKKVRTYIQGENLHEFEFDIAAYDVLVTFNGKTFDLPFLRAALGIEFPQAHIDLRYALARLGYTGGLKRCEHLLGISRGELDGVDGFMAVALWKDYVRRYNPRALDTLLAYNVEDVINLEKLFVIAYNQLLRDTPFAESHALPVPPRPINPYQPDPETVYRLKREVWQRFADEEPA
ncbi:MAG: ribonuclease H-like domain-containing protein [bacterium]|nr:ribonuclease H-like domain-containing protein [bacterium]